MKSKDFKIKDLMDQISSSAILLPAIQRNYVWRENQISSFLDSLMREYPVGSLLLWENPSGNMFKFLQEYKRKARNTEADEKEVKRASYGVMDGQQRLNSLFIAFMGKYENKELYFDINSGKDGNRYEFSFLTPKEAVENSKTKIWTSVKDICKGVPDNKMSKLGARNELQRENIRRLNNVYKNAKLSYYVIDKSINPEDVLEIFIRVNSGGTKLSKTDFLFSVLVKNWKEGKDLIKDLVEKIQDKIGESSRIDGDYILRTSMYLLEFDTKIKITDFSSEENIDKIKDNWDKLSKAIESAFALVHSWGFDKNCITSFSAIMPIAYYLYTKHKGMKKNVSLLPKKEKDFLKKFFILAQINQLFGASVNNVLTKVRACFQKGKIWAALEKDWPAKFIFKKDSAERLMNKYKFEDKSYCFLILSLLNPRLNYDESVFHIDHLHPISSFVNRKDGSMADELKNLNVSEKEKSQWIDMCNQLPNLGLLMGAINQSKGDTSLKKWLNKHKKDYKENLINIKWGLKLEEFEDFFVKRKKEMVNKLTEILKDKPII
jgi:uncharacterized protein with ParB-like and HNH nuclease domain